MAQAGVYIVNYVSQDSVCPSGWQLPDSPSTEGNKTFSNLLKTAYNMSGAEALVATDFIEKFPLSFTNLGFLPSNTDNVNKPGFGGLYWTNNASDINASVNSTGKALDYQDRNAINNNAEVFMRYDTGGYKRYGFSVRCVKR